jgi:hypothetical protein
MSYVALTQATASWLLTKLDVLERIAVDLVMGRFEGAGQADFAEGPLRVSATPDERVIALWNAEYLSGTGSEQWGFIRTDDRIGLKTVPSIAREAFERAVFIVNQRLRGLRLEGVIHRYWESDDVHTCTAGRGPAYRFNVAYAEAESDGENSVVVVGPAYEFSQLVKAAAAEKAEIPQLVAEANGLLSPTRSRPLMDSSVLAELRQIMSPAHEYNADELFNMQSSQLGPDDAPAALHHSVYDLTYDDWVRPNSSLSVAQRRVLQANSLRRHPLRLRGPAGSGKTLLMQLLAIKQLRDDPAGATTVLYITHNASMAKTVMDRFAMLGAEEELTSGRLDVTTLSDYGRNQLGLDIGAVIDVDAERTKQFQLEAVQRALKEELNSRAPWFEQSALVSQAADDPRFFRIFARLTVAEISVAIKGWSLENDEQRYVQSERALSRFHRIMSSDERRFVFAVFRRYHAEVFELQQVLDSDDIAISLYGRLRTPFWQLRRRREGYDFVFVDESQLFNANEKRVFHLLTRGDRQYVPIALALDQAQDLMGQSAGLGALGIEAIESEDLRSAHRSTRAITRLAFDVISRTSDLFSAEEYPDFTGQIEDSVPDNHPAARPPQFVKVSSADVAGDVVALIQRIRSGLVRRVAIVVLGDAYQEAASAIRSRDPSILELERRGEAPRGLDEPVTIVSRPAYIGGQEFDAVLALGLEEGSVPPRVMGADGLSYALTQQAYREMYLTFSRARYQLYVAINERGKPNQALMEARAQGLIAWAN